MYTNNKLLEFDTGLIIWLEVDFKHNLISTKLPSAIANVDNIAGPVEKFFMAIFSDKDVQKLIERARKSNLSCSFEEIYASGDEDEISIIGVGENSEVKLINFCSYRDYGKKETLYDSHNMKKVIKDMSTCEILDYDWSWNVADFMKFVEIVFENFEYISSFENMRIISQCNIYALE